MEVFVNWHITLIKLVGISQTKKEAIRDSVLNKSKVVKGADVMMVNKPVDELAKALKYIWIFYKDIYRV